MNKSNPLKRILNTRGMGGALTAFAGLIVIYIAFGIINPTVFSGQNIMNLLRSMSKYLLIGIGQSYILITGNIDLSIGSVAGMSAMVSATLMTMGSTPSRPSSSPWCAAWPSACSTACWWASGSCPLHRHAGHHVRGPGRGLHRQRQPQHRRHRLRHWQGGG